MRVGVTSGEAVGRSNVPRDDNQTIHCSPRIFTFRSPFLSLPPAASPSLSPASHQLFTLTSRQPLALAYQLPALFLPVASSSLSPVASSRQAGGKLVSKEDADEIVASGCPDGNISSTCFFAHEFSTVLLFGKPNPSH